MMDKSAHNLIICMVSSRIQPADSKDGTLVQYLLEEITAIFYDDPPRTPTPKAKCSFQCYIDFKSSV